MSVRVSGDVARAVPLLVMLGLTAVSSTASPQRPPIPQRFGNGTYEASGVVGVPGANGVLFVDDSHPRHVFWMGLSADGHQATPVAPVSLDAHVLDMEDIASDGDFFYVVGSQSQGGGRKADGLVRFRFDPKTLTTSAVERAVGLRQMLTSALPDLLGGTRRSDWLNIEGLVWDPDRARLLLGLRSPMADGDGVLVPLKFRDSAAPLAIDNLAIGGDVIRLPLAGRAIRGLGYDRERHLFLILAGASTYGPGVPFTLYEWDGGSPQGLRSVATFPQHQKPEGVTRLSLGGRTQTVIVFDSSGYLVQ
jgi:hypothetical protein